MSTLSSSITRTLTAVFFVASIGVPATALGQVVSAESLTVSEFLPAFDGFTYANLGSSPGNLGAGDFSIKFMLQTTQIGSVALLSKRGTCNFGNMFDVRLFDGGLIVFEIDQDATGDHYANVANSKVVNDGHLHKVEITRKDDVLDLKVDDKHALRPATFANVNNPANLLVGTGPCVPVDGTAPFVGSITDLKVELK